MDTGRRLILQRPMLTTLPREDPCVAYHLDIQDIL